MKERIAGAGFIIVLVALLGFCVAVYAKVFTDSVPVTLQASRAGLQLNRGADVKLNGVLVGEVRSVTTSGDGAELSLALDPDAAEMVPGTVTARLLPKTLFGEKYVELVAPPGGGEPIESDAVIYTDPSREAVELETVLDQALPLLRAVPPENLAVTLHALSSSLDGRGDELGATAVRLGDYLSELNAEMPTITEDIEMLAEVLNDYDGALPDLLDVLRNLTVTNDTIVDQEQELQDFWIATQDFGDDTRVFLDRYQGRLIQFAEVSLPLLEVLETYAPEYPCLFAGLVGIQPNIEEAFSGGRLHITLEITRDNGKYEPGRDEPDWTSQHGPDCRGLPDPNVPGIERQFDNGYDYASGRYTPPLAIPGLTDYISDTDDTEQTGESSEPAAADEDVTETEEETVPTLADPTMGYAGTGEEQEVLAPLLAAVLGVPVEDVSDFDMLMWGPLLRGTEVSAQ